MGDASPRVLWVSPRWPLPASDGARVATLSLLREVARTVPAVDLLAFTDERPETAQARAELGVARTFLVPIESAGLGAAQWAAAARALVDPGTVPMTFARFRRPERLDAVLPAGERWDAVVFDGLHGAAPFYRAGAFAFPERLGRVYYRAHNVEWQLWDQSVDSAATPFHRVALRAQARAVRRFESGLLRRATAVFPVSDEDRGRFAREVPEARLETLPIGFPFITPTPLGPGPALKLLFLGKLDWTPNRDGLLWFLKEVWPEASAKRPELELIVAGSGDPGALRRTGLLDQPRIAFRGRVADLAPLYAECAAAAVPIFLGSGTRVKAIEAARYGRACVSTALGVEGIGLAPGRSYLRAESVREWIDALVGLSPADCARLGQAAFDEARAGFEASAIGDRLARVLRAGQPSST
jgi:glycosyltransferase involved in cell wall biosynthesis